MFCESCGAFVSEGQRFCTRCGAPMEAVQMPGAASAQVPGVAGSPDLTQSSAASGPTAVAQPAPATSHRRRALFIMALVSSTAALAIALAIFVVPRRARYRYFVSQELGGVCRIEEGKTDVELIRPLPQPAQDGLRTPTCLAEGDGRVYFVETQASPQQQDCSYHVHCINEDGGNDTTVFDAGSDEVIDLYARDRELYVVGRQYGGYDGTSHVIWSMAEDGSNQRTVYDAYGEAVVLNDRLYFVQGKDRDSLNTLCSSKLDGSDVKQLYVSSSITIRALDAHDGRICFVEDDYGTPTSLMSIAPDGSDAKAAYHFNPVDASDEDQINFLGNVVYANGRAYFTGKVVRDAIIAHLRIVPLEGGPMRTVPLPCDACGGIDIEDIGTGLVVTMYNYNETRHTRVCLMDYDGQVLQMDPTARSAGDGADARSGASAVGLGADDTQDAAYADSMLGMAVDGQDYFFSAAKNGFCRIAKDGADPERILWVDCTKADEDVVWNFSRDGERLFFCWAHDFRLDEGGGGMRGSCDVCSIKLDGSDRKTVFAPGADGSHRYAHLAYVFDHRLYVVVENGGSSNATYEILAMDEDGSNQQTIGAIRNYSPRWITLTKDKVYFVCNKSTGNTSSPKSTGTLYSQNLDGSDVRELYTNEWGDIGVPMVSDGCVCFTEGCDFRGEDGSAVITIALEDGCALNVYHATGSEGVTLRAVAAGKAYIEVKKLGELTEPSKYRFVPVGGKFTTDIPLPEGYYHAEFADAGDHLIVMGSGLMENTGVPNTGTYVCAVSYDGKLLKEYVRGQ